MSKAQNNEIVILAGDIGDKMSVIARIITLMLESEVYLVDTLYHIKKNLIGAVMNDQAMLLARDGKIIAYASWAFLSPEAEAKYVKDTNSLDVVDWTSGDRIWLVDVIAPYGDSVLLLNHIRKLGARRGYKGTTIKFKSYKTADSYQIREVKL